MSNTTSAPAAGQYVGYVDDPDGRGTPSLVLSCLLTLILCVWSALHLNVPAEGQSRWSDCLVTTRWILAGIYAPELVVFAAWSQWSSARILQKLVDGTLGAGDDGNDGTNKLYPQRRRRFEWRMPHSFFASTGGFAVDVEALRSCLPDTDMDQEKRRTQRLTLTARGVALLAACGCLPDVDQKQIDDKSKANDLAKAMVLVQAVWMMVQVIGRLAFRLPVTLLELNTVAHVLCAFAMYLFWWHKPLLPDEPLVLPLDDSLTPLIAFMYSSSELSGYVAPEDVKSKATLKTLFASYLSFYSKTPELETICLRTRAAQPLSVWSSLSKTVDDDDAADLDRPKVDISTILADPTLHIIEAPQTCILELQSTLGKTKATALFERRPRVASSRRPPTEETARTDRTRRGHVIRALRAFPHLLADHPDRISLIHHPGRHPDHDHNDDADADGVVCIHLVPTQLLATHIQNWPGHDLLRQTNGTLIGMTLWFANFAYGGVHAAAWGEHFPTAAEKWLWRAGAAYIGWSGGLWVLLNLAVSSWPWLDGYWEGFVDGRKPGWQYVVLGGVMTVCGTSLVLARVYLLVEAFVSIRSLPAGAYLTPSWSQVFPHF